jgi:hypothetical protein
MNKQLWYQNWYVPHCHGAILEEDLQENIDKGLMSREHITVYKNEQEYLTMRNSLTDLFDVLYNYHHDKKI